MGEFFETKGAQPFPKGDGFWLPSERLDVISVEKQATPNHLLLGLFGGSSIKRDYSHPPLPSFRRHGKLEGSTMSAGRKPRTQPEIIDADAIIDAPKFANAMVTMQKDGQSEQQVAVQSVFDLGRYVGAAMAANAISAMGKAVEIRAFEEIKKSKAFKHLPLNMPDGTFRPAENIDVFCRVTFGRGYKVMQEMSGLLKDLGEEVFEAVQRLDINRAQLRLLVNLPEDSRAAVDEVIKSGAEKNEVISLIQSLANQLDEAKAKAEEFKADIAAKDARIAIKARQLDEAEEKLVRIERMPPDEVLIELHKEATIRHTEAFFALGVGFRQVLLAIKQHHEEHGGNSDGFLAGLVGQLQHELTIIRDEFDIKDIAKVLDAPPDWLTYSPADPEPESTAPVSH
jgi:hypothetical protein